MHGTASLENKGGYNKKDWLRNFEHLDCVCVYCRYTILTKP